MKDTTARFTLRVPQRLLDRLGYIAEFEGRTKNRELEHMIRLRIAAFETEYGPIDPGESPWAAVRPKGQPTAQPQEAEQTEFE